MTRSPALAELRHGALTSRYGRLLQEARNAGMRLREHASVEIANVQPTDPEVEAFIRPLQASHGPERAQRALQLLCEHGHATSGHLFLASGDRDDLRCVASLRAAQPSAAVSRFVTGFWQNHLEEAEMSAVLTEVPFAADAYEPFTWRDPSGDTYEVLVLYSARALPPHVGLACLRVRDRAEHVEWSTSLLSALASTLHELRG